MGFKSLAITFALYPNWLPYLNPNPLHLPLT
jgi:hypothetical protein